MKKQTPVTTHIAIASIILFFTWAYSVTNNSEKNIQTCVQVMQHNGYPILECK